jgi:choline-sulfatase
MNSPNILFIMCDQLRHDWLGYRGSEHVCTPNIDSIAARGQVFTEASTNSPVCVPARIGLSSGLRPHRLGALDNHAYLPLSRTTYYQRLRDHGYHVSGVGKFDLAKPDPYNGIEGRRPLTYAWGFTHPLECEGKMHAGRGDPPNGPYTHWLRRQDPEKHQIFIDDYNERAGTGAATHLHDSVVPWGLCEDDFIGQRACEMLQSFTGEFPWHLFVSFVGPHDPFDPAPEFADKWRSAEMPDPIPFEPEGKPERYLYQHSYDEKTHLVARRQYTAYLEQIDHQIGRILDTLEARGELDSTIIAFASDHGEMLGDHGRYTKSCHYESALRVPLVIAGPGIAAGETDALVELSDLNPTLCELAGTTPASNLDARSLLPFLRSGEREFREFTFATLRGCHAVRTREWKFIKGDDDRHELYHLAKDPQERRNVLEQHPEVAEEMLRRATLAWFEDGARR